MKQCRMYLMYAYDMVQEQKVPLSEGNFLFCNVSSTASVQAPPPKNPNPHTQPFSPTKTRKDGRRPGFLFFSGPENQNKKKNLHQTRQCNPCRQSY